MTKQELEQLKEKAKIATQDHFIAIVMQPQTVLDLIERLDGMQEALRNQTQTTGFACKESFAALEKYGVK